MRFRLFVTLMLICTSSIAQIPHDDDEFTYNRRLVRTTHSFVPKNGFVPDKETAVAIAYAVAVPVYGKKEIDQETPFRTELQGGVWTVLGTMQCKSCSGGTLVMQIDGASGKILFLIHTK